ncbi:cell division protein ZapA [Granulosicoccus antarcticus]|uniref:Cell division protein ZapA n=1 Tax=Granulosicoccus antarcticus IMCC3135 TaxID=1192854 RepID=A0A2Z2NXA4_9GAMM|nr:cell division protein ZapA [Granulosicoccus antarcticus]ASJ75979.1 Cell division protein ZapA [Granulosicoccus antarcticus IMCC3135]
MNNRHKDRKADPGGNRPAKLRILDKEVQIACKPGEEDDLLQAAAYIDKSMRELRNRNTTSSIEKIAIVTAINTANALLKSRSLESSHAREQAGTADEADITERLSVLNSKLDELLEIDVDTQDADTQDDVANQTKEPE